MHERKRFALSVLLCALLVAGVGWAAAAPSIPRKVLGGGGGYAEAAPYALHGTIGQAVTGLAAAAGHELSSGFWFGVSRVRWTYLPLTSRGL